MKIAINGERLTTEKLAGPELYTLNIIKGLAKVDNTNEYTILLREVPNALLTRTLDGLGENFKYIVLKKYFSWTHFSVSWWLFLNNQDIFFSAVHTIPVFKPQKLKTVAMVHGLEHSFNQDNYKDKLVFRPGFMEKLVCRLADKIVVPSDFSKDAIVATGWKLKNKMIEIIPEGVSSRFHKSSSEEMKAILSKYSLSNEYAIFVSTIQPRKNLPRLVEAFSIIDSHHINLDLVVVGKKGWGFEKSLEAPKEFNIEDKVRFLDRIPTEDLIPLLSGARLYISPSLEEGFGLPLLEAMACEVTTVVSDIPPYKELAAETSFFFNPLDTISIANTIKKVVKQSERVLTTKISEGKKKSSQYTWTNSAKKLLKIFSDLKV